MIKYVYAALAALAICGALAFASYTKGYGDAKIAAMEQWSAELAKRESEALEVTESLIKGNAAALRAKDAKIKTLTASVSSLRRELQSRPSRGSVNPGTPQACTGRELYREDGEFLAGEAAAAEKLILERDFYYERYEEVRKQLNKLRNE